MFRNREEAGNLLAKRLKNRPLERPLVLGIPRGGVVLGAVIARALDADLDVVLARKLRAPGNPEYALGAVSEAGEVFLHETMTDLDPELTRYLDKERAYQMREIARRARLFRGGRPPLPMEGRSVIVTDDGVATGSTLIAALRVVREHQPRETIVAVPVGARDRLETLRPLCDEIVCLLPVVDLYSIGQFFQDFSQVEDEEVLRLLDASHQRSPT